MFPIKQIAVLAESFLGEMEILGFLIIVLMTVSLENKAIQRWTTIQYADTDIDITGMGWMTCKIIFPNVFGVKIKICPKSSLLIEQLFSWACCPNIIMQKLKY